MSNSGKSINSLPKADIEIIQGLPHSTHFDDNYYSKSGYDESVHNFINGNQLVPRWQNNAPQANCFTIAETGFGTGLNFLATLKHWHQAKNKGFAKLRFISIEGMPLAKQQLAELLSAFEAISDYTQPLIERYPEQLAEGYYKIDFPEYQVELYLLLADIQQALADYWPSDIEQVNAWFLDGFAPSKNPDMWQACLFNKIASTAQSTSYSTTTAATFSVAGTVKRGLTSAGFKWQKAPGFGQKREMLIASAKPMLPAKQQPWFKLASPFDKPGHALVLGAGVAGCNTSYALAKAGWQVTVCDPKGIAEGASGCIASAYYPAIAKKPNPITRFQLQAYRHLLKQLSELNELNALQPEALSHTALSHTACGVMLLANSEQRLEQFQDFVKHFDVDDIASLLSAEQASKTCGINQAGLYFKDAGYLKGKTYCQALINAAKQYQTLSLKAVAVDSNALLSSNSKAPSQIVYDDTGQTIGDFELIIDCRGAASINAQVARPAWATQTIKGQASYIEVASGSPLAAIKTVLCEQIYLAPSTPMVVGSSYETDYADLGETKWADQQNITALSELLALDPEQISVIGSFTGERLTTEDLLPIVGPYSDKLMLNKQYPGLAQFNQNQLYPVASLTNNYVVNTAYGSRGFTQSALASKELVNYLMTGQSQVIEMLHPSRFLIKHLQKSPEHRRQQVWD